MCCNKVDEGGVGEGVKKGGFSSFEGSQCVLIENCEDVGGSMRSMRSMPACGWLDGE